MSEFHVISTQQSSILCNSNSSLVIKCEKVNRLHKNFEKNDFIER